MKIVILGSTSTIARGLMDAIQAEGTHTVIGLSRSAGNLNYFLEINRYAQNKWHDWDLCINCIGKGDAKTRNELTRQDLADHNYWDDLVLDALDKDPRKKYAYLSSAIVTRSVSSDDPDYNYWILKKYIEAKHGLVKDRQITDVRIPAVMSRYLRPDAGFFVTEAVRKVLNNEMVDIWGNQYIDYTTPAWVWRYIAGMPKQLQTKLILKKEIVELIDVCLNGGHIADWSSLFTELYEYIRRRKDETLDSVADKNLLPEKDQER